MLRQALAWAFIGETPMLRQALAWAFIGETPMLRQAPCLTASHERANAAVLAGSGIVKTPMYVFTQNAFLCLVAHEHDERLLEVRARFEGDIERTFPEAEVAYTPSDDYPYSTSVSRDRAVERIKLQVEHIGYRKFNPGSDEPWRQTVYSEVESVIRMCHKD